MKSITKVDFLLPTPSISMWWISISREVFVLYLSNRLACWESDESIVDGLLSPKNLQFSLEHSPNLCIAEFFENSVRVKLPDLSHFHLANKLSRNENIRTARIISYYKQNPINFQSKAGLSIDGVSLAWDFKLYFIADLGTILVTCNG